MWTMNIYLIVESAEFFATLVSFYFHQPKIVEKLSKTVIGFILIGCRFDRQYSVLEYFDNADVSKMCHIKSGF